MFQLMGTEAMTTSVHGVDAMTAFVRINGLTTNSKTPKRLATLHFIEPGMALFHSGIPMTHCPPVFSKQGYSDCRFVKAVYPQFSPLSEITFHLNYEFRARFALTLRFFAEALHDVEFLVIHGRLRRTPPAHNPCLASTAQERSE